MLPSSPYLPKPPRSSSSSSHANIRIARARDWDQTVISRGKGPDCWARYVEGRDNPPTVVETQRGIVQKAFETAIGRFIIKKRGCPLLIWRQSRLKLTTINTVALFPISLYPGAGVSLRRGSQRSRPRTSSTSPISTATVYWCHNTNIFIHI